MSKSDTVTAAVEAMQKAQTATIAPPDHVGLTQADRPFWDSLMRTRAPSLWTPADLVLAGQLARAMRQVEEHEAKLEAEGAIYADHNGNPKPNPRVKMVQDLSRQCIAVARLLQVHPLSTSGRSENQVKRNEAARNARESMSHADELIARPVEH